MRYLCVKETCVAVWPLNCIREDFREQESIVVWCHVWVIMGCNWSGKTMWSMKDDELVSSNSMKNPECVFKENDQSWQIRITQQLLKNEFADEWAPVECSSILTIFLFLYIFEAYWIDLVSEIIYKQIIRSYA